MKIQGNKYLFIDAGYARENYARGVREWYGGDGEIDFPQLIKQYGAQKTFYYDCEDTPRTGEDPSVFAARKATQDKEFNNIRKVVATHVKLGKLVGDKSPRRQKGVDVQLAVDMMNHAIRKNMTYAILLAGDADYVPLVQSLVDMGLHIEVAADPKTVAQDLAHAADNFLELNLKNYHEWTATRLQSKYPLPSISVFPWSMDLEEMLSHNSPYKLVREGSLDGHKVKLIYNEPPEEIFTVIVSNYTQSGDYLIGRLSDAERLDLYWKILYGEITWHQATS